MPTCGNVCELTGAVCTLGDDVNHWTHSDTSDPGCIISWENKERYKKSRLLEEITEPGVSWEELYYTW